MGLINLTGNLGVITRFSPRDKPLPYLGKTMVMIIEIVDTDYYSKSNDHVVLLEGVDIKAEYKIWKSLPYMEQRVLLQGGTRWSHSFGVWLVHHNKARWPEDSEFFTFEESYN